MCHFFLLRYLCHRLLALSPFDDATTAQPRLRPLPPAPHWLVRLLGLEGDAQSCCAAEPPPVAGEQQGHVGAYSSLQQPLTSSADC